MEFKKAFISELKPARYNPRKDLQPSDPEYQRIKKSIEEFGYVDPVIVNSDYTVIGGHQRLKVLKELGHAQIDVVVVDIPKNKEKALNVALNKISGEWDTQRLTDLLGEIKADGLLELTGFDEKEFDEMLRELHKDDEPQGSGSPIFSNEEIIESAYKHYIESEFPYPRTTVFEAMQEINKLSTTPKPLHVTHATKIADCYNKHRFGLAAIKMMSPVQAYKDPSLKKQFGFLIDFEELKDKYYSAIGTSRGCQECSNFRSGIAPHYYRKYAKAGDIILDTSMGFGGRLIGYIASGIKGKYIGIDPNTLSFNGNNRIASDLKHSEYVELYCSPVEDLDPLKFEDRCNFQLTSPPYFTKEEYSEEETQSFKRYPDYDDWLDGFLRKMFEFQYLALKKGSFNCINIDDVKIGNKKYPLIKDAKEIADETGFSYIQTDDISFSTSPSQRKIGEDSSEPMLIFKKER